MIISINSTSSTSNGSLASGGEGRPVFFKLVPFRKCSRLAVRAAPLWRNGPELGVPCAQNGDHAPAALWLDCSVETGWCTPLECGTLSPLKSPPATDGALRTHKTAARNSGSTE